MDIVLQMLESAAPEAQGCIQPFKGGTQACGICRIEPVLGKFETGIAGGTLAALYPGVELQALVEKVGGDIDIRIEPLQVARRAEIHARGQFEWIPVEKGLGSHLADYHIVVGAFTIEIGFEIDIHPEGERKHPVGEESAFHAYACL